MSYLPLRSWLVGPVKITESRAPDSVIVTVGGCDAIISKEEFGCLCGLYSEYGIRGGDYVRFADKKSFEDESP